MIKRLIDKLKQGQKGITGLETAIILIAFVVVAAVFAYAILSAGMYSSQKSQEAVYKGLGTAQNATTLKGAVIAKCELSGPTYYISQITFSLSNAMGGEPNDFTPPTANTGTNNGRCLAGSSNKVVITYIDPYQKIDDLYWSLTKLGNANSNNLLEDGELFQITIGDNTSAVNGGTNGGNLLDALNASGHPLGTHTKFTLEIKTPNGSTLVFERTTPDILTQVVNLN